jgi:2,3-bisphosphoglycerate-dependent phosphoglycerate mutase
MNDSTHYTGAHGKLIVVRHAESEWNELGKWTGRTEVHLTHKGQSDARLIGEALKSMDINYAFTSDQVRTVETLQAITETAAFSNLKVQHSENLNERDYGEFTGRNKWEVKHQIGEAEFLRIRRGWDHPIPGGETLQIVYNRVVPFYQDTIVPLLNTGNNVLIVSHGNTLRALLKFVRSISNEDIASLEISFDTILLFEVDHLGKAVDGSEIKINISATKA